jgi:D-xylose transport system substrate-binding protein
VDLYIGFDLYSVGVLQAQTLTEHAPKGNYILLGGSRLDPNSKVVRAGQVKVLPPLIDRGDIKVLADIWVPEWSPTQAYFLVTKALHDLKAPLTAIPASNVATAGGVIQALEDNHLAGKVAVTGQDCRSPPPTLPPWRGCSTAPNSSPVYKPFAGEARTTAAVTAGQTWQCRNQHNRAQRYTDDQGDPADAHRSHPAKRKRHGVQRRFPKDRDP